MADPFIPDINDPDYYRDVSVEATSRIIDEVLSRPDTSPSILWTE
jgi:hypothetical protein